MAVFFFCESDRRLGMIQTQNVAPSFRKVASIIADLTPYVQRLAGVHPTGIHDFRKPGRHLLDAQGKSCPWVRSNLFQLSTLGMKLLL